MSRWRSFLPALLLAGLVACGEATTSTGQALIESTAAAPTRVTTPAAAAPRASATAIATAARPGVASPTVAPTIIAQPNGAIPNGWQVYRGPIGFPFVIAYPPNWTVDDSYFPDQQIIYINGPSGTGAVEIEASSQQPGANIDVLRDEFFRKKSDFCDKKGIVYTERRQISGVPFAILGATCEQSNDLTLIQVASGVKNGDEWSIFMRTAYERYEVTVNDIFNPMLASLNIYALLPP